MSSSSERAPLSEMRPVGSVRVRLELDEWDGQAWQRTKAGDVHLTMGAPGDMKVFVQAIRCVGLNARGEYGVVGTVKAPT